MRRYDPSNVATEDVLHQPARAQIFAPMYQVFQAARDAGAHGVYLSGGGSAIAAFATDRFEEARARCARLLAAHGHESQTRVCKLGRPRRPCPGLTTTPPPD